MGMLAQTLGINKFTKYTKKYNITLCLELNDSQ